MRTGILISQMHACEPSHEELVSTALLTHGRAYLSRGAAGRFLRTYPTLASTQAPLRHSDGESIYRILTPALRRQRAVEAQEAAEREREARLPPKPRQGPTRDERRAARWALLRVERGHRVQGVARPMVARAYLGTGGGHPAGTAPSSGSAHRLPA